MRSSLVAVACALGAVTCLLPDEVSTTATFHVWCQTRSASYQPVVGTPVDFATARYDYDGVQDRETLITSAGVTASYDPLHPGMASFVVSFALLRHGDLEEFAVFTCSTLAGGTGGTMVSKSDYRTYSEVVLAGIVDVVIELDLP
jgi:hypothetical protein